MKCKKKHFPDERKAGEEMDDHPSTDNSKRNKRITRGGSLFYFDWLLLILLSSRYERRQQLCYKYLNRWKAVHYRS